MPAAKQKAPGRRRGRPRRTQGDVAAIERSVAPLVWAQGSRASAWIGVTLGERTISSFSDNPKTDEEAIAFPVDQLIGLAIVAHQHAVDPCQALADAVTTKLAKVAAAGEPQLAEPGVEHILAWRAAQALTAAATAEKAPLNAATEAYLEDLGCHTRGRVHKIIAASWRETLRPWVGDITRRLDVAKKACRGVPRMLARKRQEIVFQVLMNAVESNAFPGAARSIHSLGALKTAAARARRQLEQNSAAATRAASTATEPP